MSDYFGDASYWLALVDENDQYHDIATQYSAILDLENARIVTTQLVLNEVLAPRSGTTPERRQDTVHLVDRILRDPDVHVVPQLPEQFGDALRLLRARALDKEWSITDCASFLVMERFGIWEALTSDHHFEQAGFTAMLH